MQQKYSSRALRIGAIAGALVLGSLTAAMGQGDGTAIWAFGGSDLFNTRNAATEKKITAANVGNLKVKWAFTTHGDVSATPTVETTGSGGTTVYAVDWGGYLYSLNGDTGVPNWSHALTDYTGNSIGSVSRTSPTIVGNTIIIGDQGDLNSGGTPQHFGTTGGTTASVMAISKSSGKLVWRTVVSDHPFSIITSSPVAYNGVLYVGVASLEENAGFLFPYGYPGFSFRGKVVALDAKTGAILWSTPTISDSAYGQGYTGASVWGSTPVVDAKRGSVYVATGNNYSSPPGIGNPATSSSPADNHIDSVLALDLQTGALKWAFRAQPADTWDVYRAFVLGGDPSMGPDYDFGSGPNLFTANIGGQQTDLLGAGEKSGQYWALNPKTGAVVWSTQVGPGGTGGGIEWGSAVDGKRVYVAISNTDGHGYNLVNPSANTATSTSAGLWSSLDAATGNILWQTADPLGGHDVGMVTSANGVMFAGSAGIAPNAFTGNPGAPGGFFALNAANGNVLWSFPTGGSVICGPAVLNGTVYWGSGYSHLNNAFGISGGYKLYAFSLK